MSNENGKVMLAALRVYQAWMDTGTHPKYHMGEVRSLAQRWPTLVEAIQDLVNTLDSRWAEEQIRSLARELTDSNENGADNGASEQEPDPPQL